MALDAEDQARLGRIESDLASADPALATRLRSWQPPATRWALVPGWSVLPRWTMAVFLVGFTAWVLSPAIGTAVVLGIAVFGLWKRAADRLYPPDPGVPGGGGSSRPPGRRRRS